MIFDQFNAVLTLVGRRRMAQLSVNGRHLHSLMSPKEITAAAFLPIDFEFDRRVVVVGHIDGSISLIYVDPQDYELKSVNRPLHRDRIVCMTVDPVAFRMATVDGRGTTLISAFTAWDPGSVIQRCAACGCAHPGKSPLCENCRPEGSTDQDGK
jgi:hypothetical protein